MEKLPLIHIGYVKTGSTWLQNEYFGSVDTPYESLAPPLEIISEIVSPNCLLPLSEEFVDKMRTKARVAVNKGNIPLLTGERLSGNPISGGHDAINIANRLQCIFNEARIIIVVREQSDMLLSCYKQYIRECGVGSLHKYVNPPDDVKLPMFDIDFFRYDRLIEYYQHLFGKDRVKVLCYEYLKENPLDFCNQIALFAGAPRTEAVHVKSMNTALRSSTVLVRSYTNWLFCRARTNPHAPFNARWIGRFLNGATKIVPRSVDSFLDRRFRLSARRISENQFNESNKKLEQVTGLKLSKYNYQIS